MSKYAVRIVMDEEQMQKDGYDIENMHATFDQMFIERLKLAKDEKEHLYIGDGKHAWSSVWAGIEICKGADWFKKYVKQWEYLTNAHTNDPEKFGFEDLIQEYREMGVM